MFLLQESIEKYGILNPLIVRPLPDGYYEIISGHRRKHAAEKLDDEIISFCPAVEIAALNETEQKELLVAMEYAQAIPSLSQAQRIRQLSKEKQLSLEKMEEIMCEVKKGEITRVAFTNEQLHKYFPNSYTPAMMKREILALLKLWKKESWES